MATCEEEGTAQEVPMTSDELVTALGNAVAAVWGDLPTDVQHDLFEAAVRTGGAGSRDKLAIFLHARHPRTTGPAREIPEPDSLGG
jgi:hypothetical protein